MPPKAKGECQTKFLWIFVNFLRLCDYDLTAAKKKNGYQMPEEFKAGFVLKDVYKKPWCLGKPIGQGGFGLIYIGKHLNMIAYNKQTIYFQACTSNLFKQIRERVNRNSLRTANTWSRLNPKKTARCSARLTFTTIVPKRMTVCFASRWKEKPLN